MGKKQSALKVYLLNLELNKPTAAMASVKLRDQVLQASIRGYKVVKIIHGYGSGGQGGVLKKLVHKYGREQVATGRAVCFCPGECFETFSDSGRKIVAAVPELINDTDWNRCNYGISILLLR